MAAGLGPAQVCFAERMVAFPFLVQGRARPSGPAGPPPLLLVYAALQRCSAARRLRRLAEGRRLAFAWLLHPRSRGASGRERNCGGRGGACGRGPPPATRPARMHAGTAAAARMTDRALCSARRVEPACNYEAISRTAESSSRGESQYAAGARASAAPYRKQINPVEAGSRFPRGHWIKNVELIHASRSVGAWPRAAWPAGSRRQRAW